MKLTLRYSVLASGSTGNAIYVCTERTRLLIDAGLSGKKITQLLEQIDQKPENLDAILVTHEHKDHVHGLGVMARRYEVPVYANAKTWSLLDKLCGNIHMEQKFHFERGASICFEDIEVSSYGISHDAVQPMSFYLTHNGKKLSIATDLGYVSEKIKADLAGSDALIFEANHDVDMLRMGKYPWNIKRRILSDVGHLSNEMCAEALIDIINQRTKKVYLAHLSQDNNMQELAKMTVQQMLEQANIGVGEDVYLGDTYPNKPTKLVTI